MAKRYIIQRMAASERWRDLEGYPPGRLYAYPTKKAADAECERLAEQEKKETGKRGCYGWRVEDFDA